MNRPLRVKGKAELETTGDTTDESQPQPAVELTLAVHPTAAVPYGMNKMTPRHTPHTGIQAPTPKLKQLASHNPVPTLG